MVKLNELTTDKRILNIGQSGTGKTRLAGTLAQLIPTVIVTADKNGLDTLRQMDVNPEIILLENWARVFDYYREIAKLSSQYQAIVFDDLGAIQEAGLDKIEVTPRTANEDKQYSKDRRAFQQMVIEQIMTGERRPQIQQWGDIYNALTEFISQVFKLPYKIQMVSCLEKLQKNPRTREDHLYPAVAGQLAITFPAKFSLVLETFTTEEGGNLYYCASCKSHPRLETKTRYDDSGGRTWINPDMGKILAYINKKGEPETPLEKRIGVGL